MRSPRRERGLSAPAIGGAIERTCFLVRPWPAGVVSRWPAWGQMPARTLVGRPATTTSASRRDARAAEQNDGCGETKRARRPRSSWYNCDAWCKIGSTSGPPRVTGLRLLGKAALRLPLVSHLEDLAMSTTRGVLHVHSAPSALCPHVEWAVGGIFGA